MRSLEEERTDALRPREREPDPVGMDNEADEASHGNTAVLDLRVAQPSCEGTNGDALGNAVRSTTKRRANVDDRDEWRSECAAAQKAPDPDPCINL